MSQPNIPEAGGDPRSDQGEQVEPPWPLPLDQVWPCFAEITRTGRGGWLSTSHVQMPDVPFA